MAFLGFGGRTPADGDGKTVRPAAVAGSFYPADKGELLSQLKSCYAQGAKLAAAPAGGGPLALIVPHAGYVFSGGVAASAYLTVSEDADYERIVLIGPSHRAAFGGAAADIGNDFYLTPLGDVPVDKAFGQKLISSGSPFLHRTDAFAAEHDLEVQLPFLQYRLKKMPPIAPIILGTTRYSVLKAVADALKPYLNGRTLFVISSDFSHYPSYAGAQKADGRTGAAIATGDVAAFVEALQQNEDEGIRGLETSACGQAAIAVLMAMTGGDDSFEYQHLAYQNSGDSPYGGRNGVVGYHAFAIRQREASVSPVKDASRRKADAPAGSGSAGAGEAGWQETAPSPENRFSLSVAEKQTLLSIARASIKGKFAGKAESAAWDGATLSDKLKAGGGAFVTLHKNGRLRGCIGHFGEDTPVYRMVAKMARAAAFEDPRFPELRASEMDETDIEISVLSPLKKIASADEFHYGTEGIYIVKGWNSGTFLPQVAVETGWSKEEFLGHCSRDKAGLGWDGWKSAELYTYEAEVFGENDTPAP